MFKTRASAFVAGFSLITLITIPLMIYFKEHSREINDMEMRKKFSARFDNFRKSYNEQPENVLDILFSVLPEILCPEKIRLGSVFDGGKWICRPWRATKNCLVLSLGSGGNSAFERDFISANSKKNCRIVVFDPNPTYAAVYTAIDGARFLPWKMTETTRWSRNESTLADASRVLGLAQNNGLTEIEVLKIDIEMSEYEVLPGILKNSSMRICQILLEIHGNDVRRWMSLLKR